MACPDTATSHKDEKEFLDIDAEIESNACQVVTKEKTFDLQPVSPYTSGEGLPYAPEGWPNPDDVWGWKVGRRANRAGYFHDRYLSPPRSLRMSSRKTGMLQSKPDVIRYIKTNFPNMKIEEFFALFSWQVPTTEQTPRKVLAIEYLPISSPLKSLETGEDAKEEIGIQRTLKRRTQSCSQPTRKSFRLVHFRPHFTPVQYANEVIDLCHLNEDASMTDVSDFEEGSSMHTAEDKNPEVDIEKFDEYLNTVEDILDTPYTEISPSDHVTSATSLDNEMMECCKKKLSSLLSIDFSSLVSCYNVVEVATLASQIRKDPNLSVDQLAKLNLVEQIPLVSGAFVEAKGNIEEADKLLADLEAKKLKIPNLKNEYNELKDKVAQTEDQMNKSTLAIQEIDDQIWQLQSKRKDMCTAHVTIQKSKAELTSKLTNVANSIPPLVNEIQLGLSKKSEWELLKANNAKRVAEIQEKFITLRGLTL